MDIILSGASGQMGRSIAKVASCDNNIKIVAGVDKNEFSADFKVFSSFNDCNQKADVLIDFSHFSAIESVLNFCLAKSLPLVIGTTGFNQSDLSKIKQAAEVIPIFHSSNMSMGVLLLNRLVKTVTKQLYGKYDIEIVEAHHNQKIDAPSGTANMLLGSVLSQASDVEPIYNRHDTHKKRVPCEVGMHSIRGGSIVGDHDVIFVGPYDKITLSHSAFSKDVFALGAIDAAKFLINKPKGYYNMDSL